MLRPLSTHQRIYGSSQGATSNPHILEERVMNNTEDSGVNEEDKYVTYLPLSQHRFTERDQVRCGRSWLECLRSTGSAKEPSCCRCNTFCAW